MKKYAEFFVASDGRVVVSVPSDAELRELVEGLRKLGIEVHEEVRSLCG